MKGFRKFIYDVFRVWKNEFRLVIRDKGIMIFLFLLPLAYPIVYALIYNPEVARDVPVVVVDESRSTMSRSLARKVDASEGASVAGYAANMDEARRAMAEKDAYGILFIPSDFDKNIGRGEQSTATLYCDMSLLIRYKSLLTAVTGAVFDLGGDIQVETFSRLGASAPKLPSTVSSTYFPLGNPGQGFATFLLPGILVLIVQQTLILAVCMMGGAIYERKLRYGGVDPLDTVNSGALSRIIGKAMAYALLYVGPLVYLLHFVPIFFSYPQNGSLFDILLLCVPYVFAAVFLGMALQMFVRERETSFVVIVFTSVIFLFLSGVLWPIYDMSPFFRFLSGCCPSSWAMQAFVRINANGATLSDVRFEYGMLWLCCGVYFMMALLINKVSDLKWRRLANR